MKNKLLQALNLIKREVYIGISKLFCLPCYETINQVNQFQFILKSITSDRYSWKILRMEYSKIL